VKIEDQSHFISTESVDKKITGYLHGKN